MMRMLESVQLSITGYLNPKYREPLGRPIIFSSRLV